MMTKQRLRLCLLAAAAIPLAAQVGDRADLDRSDPPPTWTIPAAPVLVADESLRRFDLPPGFRVELVAAEPLVQDPVSVTFDERGRAWVIEWPGYNWPLRGTLPGLAQAEKPKSRVVILEDTDGDGRMDKRTVFMDGMNWARGVQPARDGALVLKLPQLVFARDRNGDGVADSEEVLIDGLEIAANLWVAQADVLRLLDNRVYGSRFPWRWRDTGDGWDRSPHLSTRGQWGISQDNFGRLYYASNTDHLIGDLVPGHYFTRNPNYTVTAGVDFQIAKDQRVWPHAITPGVNRRGQVDEDGKLKEFTANTGPLVYRGDQFGPEYAGNVFLSDVAGRLIRRDLVTEKDGLLSATNAYDRREFLFSHDERFRPVYTANGPDGALYVVDMYRGIIEGYLFQTSYLRKQILARGLEQPFGGLGRIYRIVRADRPVRRPTPPARDDAAGWLELLADANGFWRDTAQRVLVERGDRGVVPALRTMAYEQEEELARLHALWTLEGLGAVTAAKVERALGDPSFRVRQAALRVAEPWLHEGAVAARVIARMDDDRIEVRRQLLFTLGEGRGPAFEQAMSRVLQRDAAEPFMLEAALSGLKDRELALLERMLGQPGWQEERPGYGRVFAALAQAVMNANRTLDVERLLAALDDAAERPAWMRLALLDGLAGARVGRGNGPVASLAGLEQSTDAAVRLRAGALRKIWADTTAPAAGEGLRKLTGPLFERGQTLFAICGACHGPEGKGLPGVAPALVGSRIVAGQPEELIRSVLFGRNQDRRNPAFPDMPPFNGLGDEDVAAVVSYVRAQWGGVTRPLNAGAVRRVRETPNVAPAP